MSTWPAPFVQLDGARGGGRAGQGWQQGRPPPDCRRQGVAPSAIVPLPLISCRTVPAQVQVLYAGRGEVALEPNFVLQRFTMLFCCRPAIDAAAVVTCTGARAERGAGDTGRGDAGARRRGRVGRHPARAAVRGSAHAAPGRRPGRRAPRVARPRRAQEICSSAQQAVKGRPALMQLDFERGLIQWRSGRAWRGKIGHTADAATCYFTGPSLTCITFKRWRSGCF